MCVCVTHLLLFPKAVIASSDYQIRPATRKNIPEGEGEREEGGGGQDQQQLLRDDNVLLLRGSDLSLVSAVGLERDPHELSVFELRLGSARVRFGPCAAAALDPASVHFRPDSQLGGGGGDGDALSTLLAPTDMSGRAWVKPESSSGPDVMELVARILFDPRTNLKTISLAFRFSEVGVRLQSLVRQPEWVDWLARFFTVVEYPVDG